MSSSAAREKAISWAERSVAIALTALVALLHVAFLTHAGALWRDEVNTLAFAGMPSLTMLYSALQFDPFPLLSTLLLRGWLGVTAGGSDASIRVFGLLVGFGSVGAVWLSARLLRSSAPLLSLALIGLNPVAVRTTDSIRPYGVGIVLIVITLGLLWRAVEAPTLRRLAAAGALGVLGVQCLYQNAFLLFGFCLAAVVVSLRDGRAKIAGAVGMLGAAAAVSLVPYWPSIVASRSWNVVNQSPIDVRQLLSVLFGALGSGGVGSAWLWIALVVLCCGVALSSEHSTQGGRGGRLALFSATALLLAATAFLVALHATGLPTQVWYYVPLMTAIAPLLDATVWAAATSPARRIGRLVLVLAIAGTAAIPAWKGVQERQTNVDLVASALEQKAAAGDVIVVYPWYYGVSFQRYYRGQARWVTLPPIDDLRIHRYDLLKATMTRSDPIDSVLEAMAQTLQSGRRVWLVGGLPFLRNGEQPRTAPPAPHAPWGWSNGPYLVTWARQAAYLLQTRARSIESVPVSENAPVNRFENVTVAVVSGWR